MTLNNLLNLTKVSYAHIYDFEVATYYTEWNNKYNPHYYYTHDYSYLTFICKQLLANHPQPIITRQQY